MSLVLVLTLVVGWSPREEISWVLNGTIGSCWRACAVGDLLDSGVVCVSRTLRTTRKMCKSGIQTVGKLNLEARRDIDQCTSG